MKVALLRLFSGLIVIALTVSAVAADQYALRLRALEAEENAMRVRAQQEERLDAIEADKRKEAGEEQQRLFQQEFEEEQKQGETYTLEAFDGETSLFTNKVDGYSVLTPADMKVDMSFSNVRAVLEDDSEKLEIYRQKIDDPEDSVGSYINYSNQFINNQIDHYKELEGNTRINGRSVSYLQWSRKPLAKIADDKCHYAAVDVTLSDREVITFLFKSSLVFENKSYLDVVRSLALVDQTAEPYIRKILQTENRNWDQKTADTYGYYFGRNSRLHWGIFENGAPVNFTELKIIEQRLDFTFPILLYYTAILENKDMHPNLAAALTNAKKEGRTLELTLQTIEQTPGKGNMVYDILDGKYDTYLNNYAKEVANYGEPILFRLGNEMNGDWCVYSSHHTSRDTDIYKAFYRYVYQIFRNAGADNVIWVWNPNGKAFPDYKWNNELCYYPGDGYVDVVGMTSYNTGNYYKGEDWMEFSEMYDSLYQKYISLYEKPLMITEFSSSSVGGSKEAWVADMFRNIIKYDRIKVAVWWDGCDWDARGNVARSYFIDETEELVKIFRENLARFK